MRGSRAVVARMVMVLFIVTLYTVIAAMFRIRKRKQSPMILNTWQMVRLAITTDVFWRYGFHRDIRHIPVGIIWGGMGMEKQVTESDLENLVGHGASAFFRPACARQSLRGQIPTHQNTYIY